MLGGVETMDSRETEINALYDDFLDNVDMALTELWVIKSEHAIASVKKQVLLDNIKAILQLGQRIQGQLTC